MALDRHGDRDITTGRYDAIIVLGCRVMPDGHASTSLARRARHGALLWHRGLAPRLVLTGGIGDYPPSEASVAMDLIRAQGVPEDRIALEERSTSTDENLRFAAENLRNGTHGRLRVLIVTDSYHVFRSELVARRYFDEAYGVGTVGAFTTRSRGALREVWAVIDYAVRGRL